jgi:hypothetical protein
LTFEGEYLNGKWIKEDVTNIIQMEI